MSKKEKVIGNGDERMPETLAQEQKRTKPELESIIATRASMDSEAKHVAYSFLEYCKSKKIVYKWSSTNRWNLRVNSKIIGYIGIGVRKHDDNSWNIILSLSELLQYEDFIQKENLEEIIYNHIHYCENCNKNACSRAAVILGKELHSLCGISLCFKNPNASALESIMKILDFRLAISHGTANRPILDPATQGLVCINNKLCVTNASDLDGKANKNISHLFDGKYNSYFYAGPYESFMSTGDNHSIILELDKPVELTMYSLVTGLRLDVPSKWTLYGSASKDEPWTQLDTQDKFPKPVTLYTENAFKVSTPKTYKYYRITFECTSFVLSQVHLYISSQ